MSDETQASIRVRGMEVADWRDVHAIWTHPDVIWGTLQVPYRSADDNKKKIENPPEGMIRLVAEVEGRVVGLAGLHPSHSPRRRHVADCGVSVHPDCWDAGVGSALVAAIVDLADNWLSIIRLELEVYVDNAAAIHLYEKFGFVIEGTKRQYALRAGDYVDTHVMGRVGAVSSSPEGA